MEFQKITNFLDITSDNKDLPKFVTKKWIEVYDQSEGNYNVNKEIRIKTSMLRSDLCDYSDAYIVVKGTITVTNLDNGKRNKSVTFKNKTPFINCISKINGEHIDNAEDLDVVIPSAIYVNTAKSIEKQQAACGITTKRNQEVVFLILNHLNTRQILQEILIVLVMVKLIMMQTKSVKMRLKLLFHLNI